MCAVTGIEPAAASDPTSSAVPHLAAAGPPDPFPRFYAHPAVRQRIDEHLGRADGSREPTAVFVCSPTPRPGRPFEPHPVGELRDLLGAEVEAARSLWDRGSLIAHLDIEHVHFDRPWQPLAEPERSAALQRPLVEAIGELLSRHGIAPLHLLTGRGHHFAWRIDLRSSAFVRLTELGTLSAALRGLYLSPQAPAGAAVGEALGAAHHGLGKVLERLAHRAVARAAGRSAVPVQVTAVAVGPGPAGREIVSFDLSAFADPLDRRSIRLPFTAYRKAAHLGAPAELSAKIMVAMPVAGGDEDEARNAMTDLGRAAALAERGSAEIPEASRATEGLISEYLGSGLASFHTRYEAVDPEPPERWAETYDRLDLGALPFCARHILEMPNDLLLQPAAIQIVVRTLAAQGWHPRHIAGLIVSKYRRDHGWIPGIHFHEPGVRADFYARLFAGLVAEGLDGLVDFNCQSTREKGYCPGSGCGWNLCSLADRLRQGDRCA